MLNKNDIQRLKKLQQKKYRREYGEFIVEGIKSVQEALNEKVEIIKLIGSSAAFDKLDLPPKTEIEVISEKEGNKISTTETFPGVLAVVRIPENVKFENGPIVCLDKVSDPGNLGTIIRTADWFGIRNILLSEGCVDPYNPKVARSTMGSIFRENIIESTNIVQALEGLKQKGYNIISLSMDGESLSNLKINNKNVYVFGSESNGVSDEIVKMGGSYTVPGQGSAESLNVAVAAGIFFYHLSK